MSTRWRWYTASCPCWGLTIRTTCPARCLPCPALRTRALPCGSLAACHCSSSSSTAMTRTPSCSVGVQCPSPPNLTCRNFFHLLPHVVTSPQPRLKVTLAAARRRGRGRRRHCTTSSTASRTTSEVGARSECSTCWSRCATIVRPAGAGRRTMRGASTRRTTPVSVRCYTICIFIESCKAHKLCFSYNLTVEWTNWSGDPAYNVCQL